MLVNEKNPNAESTTRDANEAAGRLGKQLVVVRASTESAIARAFATLIQEKVEAILIEADPFFLARREQIVGLTAQNALPAIYAFREFVSLGGLMSYGTSLANAYHQAGIYAGKILQGEKPADLPVVQSVSFELAVNLKTAAALGLKVPLTLQVAADEVIE
jgi:putative tryptophan/tyrosine transport system substrate-binding protein